MNVAAYAVPEPVSPARLPPVTVTLARLKLTAGSLSAKLTAAVEPTSSVLPAVVATVTVGTTVSTAMSRAAASFGWPAPLVKAPAPIAIVATPSKPPAGVKVAV